MQASQLPVKFPIPFANSAGSGMIRAVPTASQAGITPGAASLTDGFPANCFLPVGSGGTPPFGQDFNGLLNQVTAWQRWQALGGPVAWDSTFSVAVGGYPKGATVASATFGGFWLCTVDNNTSNPDIGGAGWVQCSYSGRVFFGPTDTGTADAIIVTTTFPLLTYAGYPLIGFVKGGSANATASPTINVNGLGNLTIRSATGGSLTALDLPANVCLYGTPMADGTFRLATSVLPSNVRIKLTGNLNLYVRSDGNDANNGLANTSGGAFKTVQGCWNAIFGLYDAAGFTITINVGVGVPATYAPVLFNSYTGSVVLAGDPANPTGTIINCGGAGVSPINVPVGGPNLTIRYLVIQWDYTGAAAPVEATLDITGNTVTIGAGVTFRNTYNRANLYDIVVSGSGAQIIFADGVTVTVDGAGSRNGFIATSSNANSQCAIAGGTVYFKSLSTIAYGTFSQALAVSVQTWYQADFSQFTATGNQASATGTCDIVHGSVALPGTPGTTSKSNGGQIY